MSQFPIIRLGRPGCVEASAGFQEWKRRQSARKAQGQRAHTVAPLRRETAPSAASAAEVLQSDTRGSFVAQAVIAGQRIGMVVDTGATVCCLTQDDAERVGVRLRPSDFTWPLSTQNGRIMGAPVSIGSIRIEAIVKHDVEAAVIRQSPGAKSLLGMSFLNRLREVSMERGRLTLRG